MDILLFQTLNSIAGINSILDSIIIFSAKYLVYFIGGILIIGFIFPKLLGLKNRMILAFALAVALFARFVVKEMIVLFWDRLRPFDALPEVAQLIPYQGAASFPSGHAIFFFALASFLFFFNKCLGAWLFLAAFFIGVGRVVGGIHWPSDVFFGAILGITIAAIIFISFKKFFFRFQLFS